MDATCVALKSVVKDDAQQGSVDLQAAVVLDEAEFPEFIHEEVDARARCADHLSQHFLRHFRK